MPSLTNSSTSPYSRLKTVVKIIVFVVWLIGAQALSPERFWANRDLRFISTAQAAFPVDLENVALAASGAVASASSTYAGYNFSPGAAIDGERKGLNYLSGGAWHGASDTFPQWLQIDFSGSKTISAIDVFCRTTIKTHPSQQRR